MMYRRFIIVFLLVLFLDAGLNPIKVCADEAEKPDWMPDVSGEVAFETKYIWRGQTLVNDPVIQPGASVGLYGFTFSVWGNYDTGSLDRFTEWDYIFDYTFNIGDIREKFNAGDENLKFIDPLSLSLGYTLYTFPNLSGDAYDSHEIYIGLSYDVLLQPFVTYYMDFEEGLGSYWEFGVGHTFELGNDITADLGVTAGYNAGQWGYDWSFSNMLFSGEVSVPIFKYFAVSPNINYSLALDEQYNSEFYGGVKISTAY